MLTKEEIEKHVRNELFNWAILPGNEMSEKEALEFTERVIVSTLCAHLQNAMLCAELAEDMLPEEIKERVSKQLFNWG